MKPSKTSIYVAAARAIGAREPDPTVRNPDFLAERLLGDPAAWDVDHPVVHALAKTYEEALADREVLGTVATMTVRTRFVDDALRRAVEGGAAHVVIMGAGFDTRAYRLADLLAGAHVFEVDRPQTQEVKKQRIAAVVGEPPPNLTYVPIDFQHESLLEVLARHGHDPASKTFFIWEGVTMYLPVDAVRSTLRFVAAHAPGSTIVFDYISQGYVDMIARIDMDKVPEAARPFVQRFLNLTRDEPWIFGLPDNAERDFLGEFGLDVVEILPTSGAEAVKRYLTRPDGTRVGNVPLPEPGAASPVIYHLMEAAVTPAPAL